MVDFAVPRTFMRGYERREERESTMDPYLDFPQCGSRLVLPQLVDAVYWLGVPVYSDHRDRLCPDACRRSVYEPTFEEQHDGRPFQ